MHRTAVALPHDVTRFDKPLHDRDRYRCTRNAAFLIQRGGGPDWYSCWDCVPELINLACTGQEHCAPVPATGVLVSKHISTRPPRCFGTER